MKKLALAVTLGATLALLFWLFRTGDPATASSTAPAIAASPRGSTTESPVLAAADDARAEPREVVRAPEGHIDDTAAPASAAATESALAPPPSFDPAARGWIHLIVQDARGAPIANAEIRMTALRTSVGRGSGWRPVRGPSFGHTAADGSVTIDYAEWIDAHHPTSQVAFRIQHPEFMELKQDAFDIDPTPQVIVLQHGPILVVSGWIESEANVVREVEPQLTWDTAISQDEWTPIGDGRMSSSTISPGRHGIYLSHTNPTHGRCFSEVAFFDIAPGEQKELRLQLLPGRRFEGRLDASVPRPITHGEVLLNLLVGTSDASGATMLRPFKAPISAEGTFAFADLPPGDGQIIGICDGWASTRVLKESKAEKPRLDRLSTEQREKLALRRDSKHVPQSVTPGASDAPFELLMEQTATVVATIVDPEGLALAGITLNLWPSVHWRTGDSSGFMDHAYGDRSDEHGRVTVSNVPCGVVKGGIEHQHFELPESTGGHRRIQLELTAGETHELRIQLERRKGE